MRARAADAAAPTAPTRPSDGGGRTHPSVQVVALGLCALAAAAIAPVTHLTWFGSIPGDPSVPNYSAISSLLVPPESPAGLVPGTRSWGYLVLAWSVLLAVAAVVALVACATLRARRPRAVRRLLVAVGVGSLVLLAIVASELSASVHFDIVSYAGFGWGALAGLGLAMLSSLGAWFAWATFAYPHRWGVVPSAA